MTERKKVNTLKKICLSFISKTLSVYSDQELHTLPCTLTEDLIQFLYDEDCARFKKKDHISRLVIAVKDDFIRFSEINRLIRPNIRRLNIYFPNRCEKLCNDALTAVLQTSKSLTHFICDDQGTLTRKDLLKLVVSIPNIVVLKIKYHFKLAKPNETPDLINGQVLQAIGDHCFELETLHLSSAAITNESIPQLWQSQSGGRKIKHLKLDYDSLTPEGCYAIILNLKALEIFKHDHLIKAFIMLSQALCKSCSPLFQFTKLPYIKMESIPIGFLKFLTKCCPNVRNLKLLFDDFRFHYIENVKTCSETVTFSLQVNYIKIPISQFSDFGSRVIALDLGNTVADLVAIGKTFPNLSELSFFSVKYTPLDCTRRCCYPNAFDKMVKLNIDADDASPIPLAHLDFMLGNCLDLQELSIACHDELTDDQFLDLLRGNNRLRRLTEFHFRGCEQVGKKSILELLGRENNLKMVWLFDCDNFTDDDYNEIERYIQEHNYDVTLDVFLSYDVIGMLKRGFIFT